MTAKYQQDVPWEAKKRGEDDWDVVRPAPGGIVACELSEHDARLIAAVHPMRDALEMMTLEYERLRDDVSSGEFDPDESYPCKQAHAVLALARPPADESPKETSDAT